MRNRRPRTLPHFSNMLPLRPFLPLLLAGLSGCLFQTADTQVAGGAEDFPNTVALGTAVSDHISDHADWDQFSVIPGKLPSFSEADSIEVAPEGATLAKISSQAPAGTGARNALDTVTWDYSDTAGLRIVRRMHVSEGPFKIRTDTSVFRYDETAKDTLIGNELILESRGRETWKLSGRYQAYRYENTDSAGGFDRATFRERIPVSGSGATGTDSGAPAFKNRLLVMLPGPDGDLGTKTDNRPAYYGFALTGADGGADTSESFEIKDADGDGELWGDGDSGLVDFRQKTPHPIFRPAVALVNQRLRAILFKEEAKTYPISFTESRIEKDGKQVTFSVKGTRSDSVFSPGDTAWVSVRIDYPADSRLVEKHSRYHVILGGEPKRYQDNRLIGYTLMAAWRKNALKTTRLTFTPDQPVASNQLSLTGNLELDADDSDGESATGAGRFQDKIIDVNLVRTTKDGKRRGYHIRWDASGNPLSQTPTD